MRLILTIALSALMLSGCMVNWPSPRTGPRWRGGPDIGPYYVGGNTPSTATPTPTH